MLQLQPNAANLGSDDALPTLNDYYPAGDGRITPRF
jgi:hypothetical protein